MPPKPKTKKSSDTNENDDSVQTNYDRAAYAIVQMINTFDSDPDATFQQEDFDILLQSDTLASFRMTTHRWGLFFDAIKAIWNMDDPEFPFLDFVTFVLKLEDIQLNVLNFFVDFKSQLGQLKKTSQTFSLKYGESTSSSKNSGVKNLIQMMHQMFTLIRPSSNPIRSPILP